MNDEEKIHSSFLHLWQKENLVDYDDTKLGKKADVLRFSLAQLQCLEKSSKIDKAATFSKTKELLTEYGQLVDSQEKGLNNYAEPILTLLGNNNNESKKWRCKLNAADVRKKYLSPKNEQPTRYREDLALLARHLNNAKDRNPRPPVNDKNPANVEKEAVPKRFTSAEVREQNPSFDLFQEDMVDISNKREQDSQLYRQNINQRSTFAGNNSIVRNVPPQRGRGTGVKRGNYPWNRVTAPSDRRGSPVTQEPQYKKSNFYGRGGHTEAPGNPRNYGGSADNSSHYRNSAGYSNNQRQTDTEQSSFKTAAHQLVLDQQKKYGQGSVNADLYGASRKTLGIRRSVNNKFVPPVRRSEDEERGYFGNDNCQGGNRGPSDEENPYAELMLDERLKNIDPKMVELIMNEIMDSGPPVTWDDIAGLQLAKTTIQEIIVWPMLRPDIFTGLRGPPKGILLFGPPGTGKTMIGKCIASQSGSTFFSISASSLTSKWIGEGEKMVRAMFAVARCHQPAVIFIDEIDSLLTQRSDTEHESSRRIKTEFLVQLDGATSGSDERLLVVGATNRPQELDEAARRRLVKRLYIPLPEDTARQQIIRNLMENQSHSLTEVNIQEICRNTDGYSGADMANLCREAALGPIRSISFSDMKHISVDQVRPICKDDFLSALHTIKASVSDKDLQMYEDWNSKFGVSSR